MKKLLSLVLAVAIIICAAPLGAFTFSASAATEYTEGYYTYTVENVEATITRVDRSISGDITLPSNLGGYPVTSIGARAFSYCYGISGITIPDSVTSISSIVFDTCDNVTYINVSENNKNFSSISGVLFDKNISILIRYPMGKTDTTYSIPDGVISVDGVAFYSCENLTNITIPNSVTSIGDYAFDGCEELTIYGYAGSYAEAYAKENDIPFVAITDAPLFPDTSVNDWYYESVEYVVSAGIMSGYGNGKFSTSDSIQRQDFLVMLARLDGVDLDTYGVKKSAFPDVPEGSYFEAAVNWGSEKGIVTGYQNGKFGVSDKVTREQLVTFLYRYAKYKGYDYGYTADRVRVVSGQYEDYKSVSTFAKGPILWAIEKGVISGKTSTTIAPQGNAQRCEVAKIMYNIFLNDIFK